jgi:hypothetical protein
MSSSDVDVWLKTTLNPKRDVIAAVRDVVMADDRISETIKYRAPAFLHGGIMAYFHWSAKEFASLILPSGSRIPGDFDLLHGKGLQRVIRFETVNEVGAHRDQLLDIVDAWCSISETPPPRR